jgi:hypothetical protein
VQEIPINFIPSTPSASNSPTHRKDQIEEVVDEDVPAEEPKDLEFMDAVEDSSLDYTVLEAVADEFTDDDADGDVDPEIEVISAAAASLIRERPTHEEEDYLIEEPVTEGRLTEVCFDHQAPLNSFVNFAFRSHLTVRLALVWLVLGLMRMWL